MQKPNYIFDVEQNTAEWHSLRVGRVGASSAPELLMDRKTKGYQNLFDRLVEESITNEATESKTFKGNQYTERGHEFEPIARSDYEFRKLQVVKLVGIVLLGDMAHCSPDGLIEDNGLHQIKCPIFNTQKKYLKLYEKHRNLTHNEILQKIDNSYYKQCQYELFITDREYNIWTSYHPKLMPIDLIQVRDDELIEQFKIRLDELKKEVYAEIGNIKNIV